MCGYGSEDVATVKRIGNGMSEVSRFCYLPYLHVFTALEDEAQDAVVRGNEPMSINAGDYRAARAADAGIDDDKVDCAFGKAVPSL